MGGVGGGVFSKLSLSVVAYSSSIWTEDMSFEELISAREIKV